MLADAHVHIGQFHDIYYDAEMLLNTCKKIGVSTIVVSSMTIATNDYDKVISEIKQLLNQKEITIIPILWVTPKLFQDNAISKFTESKISWKCIKVHNYLQHGQWGDPLGDKMKQVTELAAKMEIPILFHTGNEDCYPSDYKQLIKHNNNQIFILAHSRPVDETIDVMKSCPNVWADTAFTPIGDIVKMINQGLIDRMLWGTDLPIMNYYYGKDAKGIANFDYQLYYKELIAKLKKNISNQDFVKLTISNFHNLYG